MVVVVAGDMVVILIAEVRKGHSTATVPTPILLLDLEIVTGTASNPEEVVTGTARVEEEGVVEIETGMKTAGRAGTIDNLVLSTM